MLQKGLNELKMRPRIFLDFLHQASQTAFLNCTFGRSAELLLFLEPINQRRPAVAKN